jgi:Acyl-CoA synthetases (AMP-forming)/AMP-acid ligases II
MATFPLALSLAGAAAGTAYFHARLSLDHDLLFFRIVGSTALNLIRAVRADQLNLFYLLEKQAKTKSLANKPFILFEGKSHTYAETYDRVLRYGTWLREKLGVREKDIIALEYQNSDTFVFLWFAIWAVGATPAFINYHLQGEALAHCLKTSDARLAVVDPRVAGNITDEVKGAVPGMRFVVFTPDVEAEAGRMTPTRYMNEVRSEDSYVGMAILIYTSGTTGMPKPAVVSWGKIYMAGMMTAKGTMMTCEDVFYTVGSLSHLGVSV